MSDDAEGFKDAPLSSLAFVVFSHSVKTSEDCFLGRFLPSLLVREPRLAAVREELDGMFSAPSGKSLPVPGERSLAFATTRLPASSGSANTRSKLGVPRSSPESPQRGESKAAYDLDDEREKQCDADAPIERQQTAERDSECFG